MIQPIYLNVSGRGVIQVGNFDLESKIFSTSRKIFGIEAGYCLSISVIEQLSELNCEFVFISHIGNSPQELVGKTFKCPFNYFINPRHFGINIINSNERYVRIKEMEDITSGIHPENKQITERQKTL